MLLHNPKKMYYLVSVLVVISLLLGACSSPAPSPSPTEPPAPPSSPPTATANPEPTPDLAPQLLDKLWMLVAFGEAANPDVVEEGTVVTALFSADGTLSGSGGCNNYTTAYELIGDQLTVSSPIASTMMFCETGSNQETAFLAALESAGRIAFTPEGRLEIYYDVGSVTERKMVFVQGETPLVDTVWVLEKMGNPNNPTGLESGMIITAIFS